MRVTSGVALWRATRMRRTRPAGPIEDILTGFIADESKFEAYGRPVGVAVAPDGVATWRRRIWHLHGRSHELAITLEGDQHVAVLARGAKGGQCAGGVGVCRGLASVVCGHMGGHAGKRVDHQALSILDLLLDLAGLAEQS